MIKLIATDMDGTLLDEHSQLPKDFFSTLLELKERNINFVVASGRPYPTLYQNFLPYSKDLYFICDNGAYIVEPGKKPILSIIDKPIVNAVIRACASLDNATVLLCGIKHSYHKACPKHIETEIDKYYINKIVVPDLLDIDDDIFKISICDFNGAKEHSFELLHPMFGKDYQVVVSGAVWVDINNKGINKGMAIKKLQEDLDIPYEETMVFGDFYNDIEMLKSAHYSFVMDNANEDMKQYGNYIAKRNDQNGVVEAIREFVLEKMATPHQLP